MFTWCNKAYMVALSAQNMAGHGGNMEHGLTRGGELRGEAAVWPWSLVSPAGVLLSDERLGKQ